MTDISAFVIPFFVISIIAFSYNKTNVYDDFLKGAAEGASSAFRVFPCMVALMVTVGALKSSGLLGAVEKLLKPLCDFLKLPSELLGLAIIRPFSGSGALGIFEDSLKQFGADSLLGKTASVMMGSTETTFYTISVYFGAAGIKNIRHTAYAAVFADILGFLMSVLFVKIIFY